jgi:tetratricopeptide (TPR) repeat protein
MRLEARLAGDDLAEFGVEERNYRETGRANLMYANALADDMDRYEDGVAIYQEMQDQSPFGISVLAHWNWASYLLALGRVEEAKVVAEETVGTPREAPLRSKIAIMEGDWDEAERLCGEIARDPARDPRWRWEALLTVSSSRAVRGRVQDALVALRDAIDLNRDTGRWYHHRQAQLHLLTFVWAADLEPVPWGLEALQADTTDRARVISGLWAAELGDLDAARASRGELPAGRLGEFDLPSSQHAFVAALDALIAGSEGRWENAVEILEPLTEGRTPRRDGNTQEPNWVKARALEEAGDLDGAARVYRWIASGNRIGLEDPPGYGLSYSFAHRKAALLYGQLGDRAKAIEHWRAFLDAFTRPDPDFEWMVEEGRAELAGREG